MGKSEVARILRSEGIAVFDSDAEVHRLYDSKEGAELVGSEIPKAVINDRVDRQILSACVLRDPTLLTKLEKKVHGEIKTRRNSFLAQQRHLGHELAALDIPLLYETGTEKDVDVVLVVSSNPEIQRARALARPGMTLEKLNMILARQMPDQEKRRRADFVVENNGTIDDLQKSVLSVIDQLKIKPSPFK